MPPCFSRRRRLLAPHPDDYLDDDCVLEQSALQRLAADGQLMAFGHEGFFQPMDTYREYIQLNQMWASGNAPWKMSSSWDPRRS